MTQTRTKKRLAHAAMAATLAAGLFLCGLPALAGPPVNFGAHMTGEHETPAKETRATGQAFFQVNADGTELYYRLTVGNVENATASHIHLAPPGSPGAAVVFLFGPGESGGGRANGVLASGIITAANLIGPLAGQQLSVLVEAMSSGGTYVNVHTNDGHDPTNEGPGDFPGGEIRGQIERIGPK